MTALWLRLACAATIIGATLSVAAFTTYAGEDMPRWLMPIPATVFVPLVVTYNPVTAVIPIALGAAYLSLPVILGRVRIPWWTEVPVVGLLATAWTYFAVLCVDAVEDQGLGLVVVFGLIQAVATVTLAQWMVVNRRRPSFKLVLVWHLLASLWLASYAFPYYGAS